MCLCGRCLPFLPIYRDLAWEQEQKLANSLRQRPEKEPWMYRHKNCSCVVCLGSLYEKTNLSARSVRRMIVWAGNKVICRSLILWTKHQESEFVHRWIKLKFRCHTLSIQIDVCKQKYSENMSECSISSVYAIWSSTFPTREIRGKCLPPTWQKNKFSPRN